MNHTKARYAKEYSLTNELLINESDYYGPKHMMHNEGLSSEFGIFDGPSCEDLAALDRMLGHIAVKFDKVNVPLCVDDEFDFTFLHNTYDDLAGVWLVEERDY